MARTASHPGRPPNGGAAPGELSGGHLACRTLEDEGAETVVALCGGDIFDVYEPLC